MSTKKYVSLSKLSSFLHNLKNLFATKEDVEELSSDVAYINSTNNENVTDFNTSTTDIAVDSELSNTSTNPVQNKVITNKIDEIEKEIEGIEVATVPTNVSAFENDAGYLTSVPSEYITETELSSKGYLTEHQSLSDYVKISDLGELATKDSLTASEVGAAKKRNSIFYIEGDSYNVGDWTGSCEDITEYYDGLTIIYKMNVAGLSGSTTLNINSIGAISVVGDSFNIGTTYPVGSIIILIYGDDVWNVVSDKDTKNTTSSMVKNDAKLFLIGASSPSVLGSLTYSNKSVYIGEDNCLYSNDAKVTTEADVTALINDALGVIEDGSY